MIDTRQQLDRRERAIRCHRSQASPFGILTPELRRAFPETSCVRFTRFD